MPARVSSGFIAVLLFVVTVFLISSGSPPQPFVTSFAYLQGPAIVTSNDECEPGSLVHCIGRQPQEKTYWKITIILLLLLQLLQIVLIAALVKARIVMDWIR